jgi:mannobiose 2-epimerase
MHVAALLLGLAVPAQAAPPPAPAPPPTAATYLALADEVEATLRRDVLGVWFPRTLDTANGGFRSDFGRDWTPGRGGEGKFSVFQGRMTWVAGQVASRRPDLREEFLPYARHGARYLAEVLWDKQYGGFYWGLDEAGRTSPYYSDGKHVYGISFAIYGAASAYQATQDAKTLELAQRAFRWMDEHAHDAKNGGYFEWMRRDGTALHADPGSSTAGVVPVAGFPVGFKSMNAHIHLLEAFAQLYEVWKDDTLRQRLEELLAVVRDRISVEPGVMNLYFTEDWRPIPDHDSYGHDVETAYLMLEASAVLGREHDPKTERMARLLVDHGLAYGWDEAMGGFCQHGTTFGRPEDCHKEWWVQMEGLNALLLMHERYGRQTGVYFKAFLKQWHFIKAYQIDPEFRGVFHVVGPDGVPTSADKGRIWKAAYHDGRTLLNVGDRLRALAAKEKGGP